MVSKRNSLERNNRESLFPDAEVIEQPNKDFVHEMIEGSPLSSSEEICHKEPGLIKEHCPAIEDFVLR